MKLDAAARNLRVLLRADSIIAEVRMRTLATRLALYGLAALVAGFGLLMLDASLYLALSESWGPVKAAAATGGLNLLLALVLVGLAALVKPGRDLDFAQEIHQSALDALMGELKTAEQDVSALAYAVRHPLDSALPAVALPLITGLIKALRKPKA
ncbi:hypothetical protein DFO45_1637 [Azorhizobium sp. AG788]|uniref:phage holin family protein n=1 Tax=Azorhizobium sp. AG788 TaxID=2183897 RepID=UPI00105CF951|nr:phage holin family protein [Azorhizobium sp. AG788]TDT96445.1 hypothetical protein DFO45_1637 [Azorhizobium sp. AG788]